MKKSVILVLLILFLGPTLHAQKKDIALTPPMGWNSWNYFACDVSEDLIKEIADAMVSTGMADAGYEYIVIDDCWQVDRDANGELVADPERFPSGIKALADYVHSKGLKFGIYSDAGRKTCQGRPGSLGYEKQDALTFEAWGVDYLKYDWCAHGLRKAHKTYPVMGQALQEIDRPIVFSVCNWGWDQPWTWASEYAHLWRTTIDIESCFDCSGKFIHKSVEQITKKNEVLAAYASPGAWNDPDMLEVGNGLSFNENIAHFSLWCMMSAPLMAGNDLRNMDEETLSILTNTEAIAINQDVLGVQGERIDKNKEYETWLKPLSNGDKALCFFNPNASTSSVQVNVKDLLNLETDYQVMDVWRAASLGLSNTSLQFELESNSVVLLRLSRVE